MTIKFELWLPIFNSAEVSSRTFLGNLVNLDQNRLLNISEKNGKLVLPKIIEQLWIDVGTNNKSEFVDDVEMHNNLFVLAFEPGLGSYRAHIQVWKHKHFALLPFGVALENGLKTFYEFSDQSPCNSFLRPNENYLGGSDQQDVVNKFMGKKKPGDKDWIAFRDLRRGQACTRAADQRLVPTIRLDEVISISSRNIDFLKIDAQGYDYPVFSSAGKFMSKIKVVQMEVQDLVANDSRIMYVGTILKKELISLMIGHGFDLIDCVSNAPSKNAEKGLQEQNCIFVNKNVKKSQVLKMIASYRVNKESDFLQVFNKYMSTVRLD